MPAVAVVLDGFGIGPNYFGNAVSNAKKNNFDNLAKKYFYTELVASGKAVGLGEGEVSGSETGHSNIGAGRVVPQETYLISQSIKDGSFFKNESLLTAMEQAKKFNSQLHLLGLLSNKVSPHSQKEHFLAILKMAKEAGIKKVYFHFFTDGRDSLPKSACEHLKEWLGAVEKEKLPGVLASLGGRFYGMDRGKNWERLKKSYYALTKGEGEKFFSAEEMLLKYYGEGLTDEYLPPSILTDPFSKPLATISDNDAVIFFNLRSDRGRQLTKLFVLEESKETTLPKPRLKNICFVTLTDFGPNIRVLPAFKSSPIYDSLPVVLKDFRQLYISETEKFPHVTYFLNGGFSDPVAGEERIKLPSAKVKSCNSLPEMSALAITETILKYLKEKRYDFIFVNYPNPDMLGHTGDLAATIKGIEYIDKCLGRIFKEILKQKGSLFIFADHGNAEEMIDPVTKERLTCHTANPVPFIVAGEGIEAKGLKSGGKLAQVVPTILDVLGVKKPETMINSLLVK